MRKMRKTIFFLLVPVRSCCCWINIAMYSREFKCEASTIKRREVSVVWDFSAQFQLNSVALLMVEGNRLKAKRMHAAIESCCETPAVTNTCARCQMSQSTKTNREFGSLPSGRCLLSNLTIWRLCDSFPSRHACRCRQDEVTAVNKISLREKQTSHSGFNFNAPQSFQVHCLSLLIASDAWPTCVQTLVHC